jgi:hypothetical protein
VARVAGGRELGADVIRIRSPLKILQVAGSAGGRQTLELAHGRALVAILALHSGVRAQQRETILVILYLLNGNIPALHGVALRAIRAHPPLVNVRVALFATLADIGEHRLDVALRAFHFLVQAPQRIIRFVVIEFRNRANGLPARGGVTVLARNRQGTVRTLGAVPAT